MNYLKLSTLCNSLRLVTISPQQNVVTRNYAKAVAALGAKKKKMGKLGPIAEKKIMPVETDANRLVNYVCGSNIYKTGEDIKIKPNNEYPDWLWNINVGQPIALEDMDPESKQYWRKLRKGALKRNNQLAKLKKF